MYRKAYLQGTALDRNAIGVEKKTEFLEIAIHPAGVRTEPRGQGADFETSSLAYRDHGHGPLIMSLAGLLGQSRSLRSPLSLKRGRSPTKPWCSVQKKSPAPVMAQDLAYPSR
jgi:hypothetical protein